MPHHKGPPTLLVTAPHPITTLSAHQSSSTTFHHLGRGGFPCYLLRFGVEMFTFTPLPPHSASRRLLPICYFSSLALLPTHSRESSCNYIATSDMTVSCSFPHSATSAFASRRSLVSRYPHSGFEILALSPLPPLLRRGVTSCPLTALCPF